MFTKQVTQLLSDDEYRELQKDLILNPVAGKIIPKSGGLRKIRWSSANRGKGKRGGIRAIYYWFAADDEIYMLLTYGKGEKDNLTARELKILRGLIKEMEQ